MNPTFEERIAKLFSMTDEVWEKHANPWSVWTRFSALPLLAVAIWSRLWIGPWAWALLSVTIYWIWINPRLFKKPLSTDNWASKAVLGERVWLNRKCIPVPRPRASRVTSQLVSQKGMSTVCVCSLWSRLRLFAGRPLAALFVRRSKIQNSICRTKSKHVHMLGQKNAFKG